MDTIQLKYQEMYVFMDEPQLILCRDVADNKPVICVALVSYKDFEFPFLCAKISENQLQLYLDNVLDLRYVLVLPKMKKWYIMDLMSSKNNIITAYEASYEEYSDEQHLPDRGFYASMHTDDPSYN